MGVRFIIGRAGSGKTHWCLQRIAASLREQPLGPVIFWIVSKQATFQAERELACGQGLPGYWRARVVSFDDLSREIISECGGEATGQVTALGRRMILGRVLCQLEGRLKFFHQVAHQPGLAVELDSTFSELERCRGDVADLCRHLAAQHPPPALAAKLHDLAVIYDAYARFLGQDRIDGQRRLEESLAAMERCPLLAGAEVYVDGFYDFNHYQRRVIAGLARFCRSVSITLTMDPAFADGPAQHRPSDELSPFYRTEEAYRRLWFLLERQNVPTLEPVILTGQARFAEAPLAMLEKWDATPVAWHGASDALEMIQAPDRRGEVDAVARRIGDLVNRGMRYRDIAVLMRSSDEYEQLIEATFREHHIPFFLDRRRGAAHHPLVQFLRSAVSVARNNYPHEPMMTLIKSGLMGLDHWAADALENYVLQRGVRHGMWLSPAPWTAEGPLARQDAEEAPQPPDPLEIESLRRGVTGKLEPFVAQMAGAGTLREMCSAVFALMESCQVRQTIMQWMDMSQRELQFQQQAEHQRVWEELVKMFDEMVEILGDQRLGLEEFQSILETGLESFDLAMTPATVDQVLVGAVDRTRTGPLAACFVLGLNEGQFPATARESTVFSDADRRILRQGDVEIEPDSQRRLLDEELLGYIAFTRASRKLFLTRNMADEDGRTLTGSPLWQRVIERFPDLEIVQLPRLEHMPLELVATPRQLVTSLMRWVRGPASNHEDADWRAIYQWLAMHESGAGGVDFMRLSAWKALSYRNQAWLSPAIAAAIAGSPLKAQTWQLESFARCPYQHFARHLLALTPRKERQITGADLSRVYHQVLDDLLGQLLEGQRNWTALSDAEIEKAIDELTGKVGRRLRQQLMLDSGRGRYLLQGIARTLRAVVATQRETALHGNFAAAFGTVRFGGEDALPPLTIKTPAGHELRLEGKIDRVDVGGDGTDAAIIDYRFVADGLKPHELFHGLSVQLPAYLLALRQNGRALAGKALKPAAAFQVQLQRPLQDQDPRQALGGDDPLFHLRLKPHGIFDAAVAGDLDKDLATGDSQVIQAHINKDGSFSKKSEAVSSAELEGLLDFVADQIARRADRIISGEIAIRPYSIGQDRPCADCEFRDLCRFDPEQMPYLHLRRISRQELLQLAGQAAERNS